MAARLIACLALVAGGLVLGSAAPASACSCVSDDPAELAARAEVAFVGVLTGQRTNDDVVAHRFAVEDVRAGDVHRSQDVVTPDESEASCGVAWATGVRMVVLGSLDEEGRVASDLCSGSVPATGATYAATLQALGAPRAPLPGQATVDLDATSGHDLLWSAAVIGVVGALGMVAVRRLARAPGRG